MDGLHRNYMDEDAEAKRRRPCRYIICLFFWQDLETYVEDKDLQSPFLLDECKAKTLTPA